MDVSLSFTDFTWLAEPQGWLSLATLAFLEIVLGIDNVIFISILTQKLPPERRPLARRLGLTGALVMRIILLTLITWIMGLTRPLFTLDPAMLGLEPHPVAFTWKSIILLAGGIFLIGKATLEIHHQVEGQHDPKPVAQAGGQMFTMVLVQIMLLDLVFSVDSVITAVGMAHYITIMVLAVVISITVMTISAGPIARFIERHPTAKMLALAFLVLIGMTLIAEGFGVHVPKGYIYFSILFAIGVEALNMMVRRRRPQAPVATTAKLDGPTP